MRVFNPLLRGRRSSLSLGFEYPRSSTKSHLSPLMNQYSSTNTQLRSSIYLFLDYSPNSVPPPFPKTTAASLDPNFPLYEQAISASALLQPQPQLQHHRYIIPRSNPTHVRLHEHHPQRAHGGTEPSHASPVGQGCAERWLDSGAVFHLAGYRRLLRFAILDWDGGYGGGVAGGCAGEWDFYVRGGLWWRGNWEGEGRRFFDGRR